MTHPSAACAAIEPMLSDHLDGTLADAAVVELVLHLAVCSSCRSLADDLAALARAAATLPPLAPSRDLWPGIEGRIAPTVLPFVSPAAAPSPAMGRWRLGAIAAGLVAVTAIATWQFARRAPDAGLPAVATAPAAPAPTSEASPPSPTPVVGSSPSAVPVAGRPEHQRPAARVTYGEEIGKLQALLDSRANDLDPATVAILESSIATIDSAIVEAQAALARDPASRFLESQLNKSLERKLGLLRQAALLTGTT